MHRRGVGRGRRDHDRVLHRAVLFQRADELGDRRALLPNRNIDAIELPALIVPDIGALLVEDRVDDHRGLAGLPVADDELALPSADRDQGVDRLETRLHRFVHRLARDDPRRLHIDAAALGRVDRPLAVDRVAEAIHDSAKQRVTDRHVHDRARAGNRVALADRAVLAEDHDADIVGFEIERHAPDTGVRKLDHLAGHHVLQAIDAGDTVADAEHLAGLGYIGFRIERGDLLLQDLRDLGGADLHYAAPFIANCNRCRRDFRLVS